ncbi:MAG: DNA mismatch repair endonuclease MutL [Clostridia bacterium]|nr:DNA mismatch repair endonuclease MutL [Clostridia bacterium]
MAEINILSSKIFNRIAAGEVIERPASVVKELVENSIDAKATNITVEILDGGISMIKVIDNGLGIEKSELKKALMPHATSKISCVKDLDNIATLGFRGEALASIASVSKISILSKTIGQDIGGEIYSEGGEIAPIIDKPTFSGTEITVSNLFYNTPVRAKFLKTDRSEENEISATMTRFILGNPNISFKYISNGKVVLQSYGDGLESAFITVYGIETIKNCFYIETEKNGIKINGYIGKHNFTKPNRGHQTVFINDRYVVNQTVSSAILNAYSSYLMKRQYPFYVLNIQLPTEFVDVNVHPNKTDVRFLNNQVVYGSLYSVVSKVLDGSSEILDIVSSIDDKIQKPQENTNEINTNYVIHNEKKSFSVAFDKLEFSDVKKDNSDIFNENKAFLEKLERERKNTLNDIIKEKQTEQISVALAPDFRVVGQALNTYLILEALGDLFFLDQHAAYERILFDKINNDFKNANIPLQPLLIPYILNVNANEFEFIYSKINVFNEIGIEIEEFGNSSFKISALPSYLNDMNISKFFNEILSDLNVLKHISANDIMREKIAQKACKSAIKSGDKLSESEINCLLDMLKGNLNLKCPHGRPIAVRITRTEIDKWFKRII